MKSPKRLNTLCLSAFHSILTTVLISTFCSISAEAQEDPFKEMEESTVFWLAYSEDRRDCRTMWAAEDGFVYGKDMRPRKAQLWTVRKGKDGWLICNGAPDKDGRFDRKSVGYLSYPLTAAKAMGEPGELEEPRLKLSQTLESNCYWKLVDPQTPYNAIKHCQATANTGDYKGWYLCVGAKVGETKRSVTLVRDKPTFRNYLYVEGP